MPDMPGTNLGAAGAAGIPRRSVEGEDSAYEEALIPASLTPDVAKEILKDRKQTARGFLNPIFGFTSTTIAG